MNAYLSIIAYPRIDPVIFQLGPIGLRWYGVAYVVGLVIGYVLLKRMIRANALRMSPAQLDEMICWLAIGMICGGRLGWWIFYHHNIYAREPWYELFAVWHGGMSFHGGLAGVVLAAGLYSAVHRTPFWNLTDCISLVAPVGLFFGRIANFINAELVGRPTSLPWGILFPGDSTPRHPSQIYEALLEGPILMLLLWTSHRRRGRMDGHTATTFLVWYGLFRFVVEFTREPDSQLGFIAFEWLTMGQLLSVVIAFVALTSWVVIRNFHSQHHEKEHFQPSLGQS